MSYTTLENIQTIIPMRELINLTNDTTPATEVGTEKVESAISYADELVNSFLRNKYILPLSYVPMIITQISTDIAAFRLYSRRPSKLPEHIQNSYEEAKKLLLSIQKEQIILDLPHEHPNETVTPPAKMVVTNMDERSKLFNDSMWSKFR